jgi:hypothetical protein
MKAVTIRDLSFIMTPEIKNFLPYKNLWGVLSSPRADIGPEQRENFRKLIT